MTQPDTTAGVLSEEERRALYDTLGEARSTVDAEVIVPTEGDRLRDLFRKVEPVVASLVSAAREAGREEGRAEMWSAYSRQYEHAEKMPRWDQDKAVMAQGWSAGRCGNCGELLPDA